MTALFLAAAGVTWVTLAAAFISKLRAPSSARAGWQALAPGWAPTVFWAPIAAEALCALGLLVPGTVGRVALILTVGLFLAFTCALVVATRRHDGASCGCFGSLSDEPVSWLSVARTGSLALVAALAAVSGWRHPGLLHSITTAGSRDVVTGLAGAALGLLALGLSVALGHARRPGAVGSGAAEVGGVVARPGDPVPGIELVSAAGESVDLRDLRRRTGVVLVVARLDCAMCAEILAEVPRWQEQLGAGARIIVVTSSPRSGFLAAYPHLVDAAYFGARAVIAAFGIQGAPSAVLLGVDQRVATPVAHGPAEIRGLLAGTVAAVQAHASPST